MRGLTPRRFVGSLAGILRQRFDPPASVRDNPVIQLLYARRSARRFKKTPLPPEVLTAILDAGRLAPSTVNLQSWAFGVFDPATWRKAFGTALPFGGAAAILVCGDMHRARRVIPDFPRKPLVDYTVSVLNAGIAAYAMNVAAEALGVASVMLSDTGRSGFYDALHLRKALGLPPAVYPLLTLVLGYPAAGPGAAPPKLPLDQIVFTERYQDPAPGVMEQWLDGMMAGFRAMHMVRSFKGQLRHYLSKVDAAEEGLRDMVYHAMEEHGSRT